MKILQVKIELVGDLKEERVPNGSFFEFLERFSSLYRSCMAWI